VRRRIEIGCVGSAIVNEAEADAMRLRDLSDADLLAMSINRMCAVEHAAQARRGWTETPDYFQDEPFMRTLREDWRREEDE
jgi:hypothetical protein